MKKTVILLVAALIAMADAVAENVVQAVPLATKAGMTADDAAFISFEMTNEEANIIALEFKVKLPDGMTFEDSDPVDDIVVGAREGGAFDDRSDETRQRTVWDDESEDTEQ